MNELKLAKWTLFAVLIWTWPFPLFGLEGTLVPVTRFLQLAATISVLILFEGAGGMVGALFGLFWVHTLVYGLILFGLATLIVRGLASRLSSRMSIGIVGTLVLALFVWASLGEPYDTQFHHTEAHASFSEIHR